MKVIRKNPTKYKIFRMTKEVWLGYNDAKEEAIKELRTVYLDYRDSYFDKNGEAIDNFVFEDIIIPNSFYRGRSAAGFVFTDKDKNQFTMKISKVEELLKAIADRRVQVIEGGFKGLFTFVKQGENYSLRLVED